MQIHYGFKQRISLAHLGHGHNVWIEVFSRTPAEEKLWKQIFEQIDHKNLDHDVNLGIQRSTPALIRWLGLELLRAGIDVVSVRWQHDDGRSWEVYGQAVSEFGR